MLPAVVCLSSLGAVSVANSLVQVSLLGEAIDNGPAVVFVADETRRYVAVSRRACDVLGYTREELLALQVADVAAYEEAADEYDDLLQTGSRDGTSTLRRKDGSTVTFHYRAGTTTVAGMTLYVAVGDVEP